MSDLQCLLYMSTASRDMEPGEVDRLLRRARVRNQSNGLTGALLQYGGRFVQVLEGQPAAVAQCFARIRTDPRHRDVTCLYTGEIEAPTFPDWSMRYVVSAGQPDRAVSAFLDQLLYQPSPDTVRQALALLRRLASGHSGWQAH